MKSRYSGRIWLVVLLIAVIVLFIVLVTQFVKHTKDTCDYYNSNKSYVTTAPNCVINFMCTQGHIAFRDECGCGCAVSS
jgi:hypothetical protein